MNKRSLCQRDSFFAVWILFVRRQGLARLDEDPGDDGYDAEEGRGDEGVVPAVVGDEVGRDDGGEDAADVAPEVHPARYGAGVFAAQGDNRGPAGAHGEA